MGKNHDCMKIMSVVAARPNFMKIAPFCKAIEAYNANCQTFSEKVEHILVHTGQHYDINMSEAFFTALGIPSPDVNLEVGSGSHAEQVGQTMMAFEQVVREHLPDWVVVVGDVNATLACSVTARKEGVRLCHIEAGLRSGDMNMPEEINRLVTDRLSNLLLVPDRLSMANLHKEGVPEEQIHFVGNIMIDTLEANRKQAEKLEIADILKANQYGEKALPEPLHPFAVVTLHRPSNVDRQEILQPIIAFLRQEVSRQFSLIWPLHPRTRKNLEAFGLLNELNRHPRILLTQPLGYHELLRLNMDAEMMLTDSGGLQEECTVLGTPCITLRWNTERPVTLREHGGASVIVGNEIASVQKAYQETLQLERQPVRPDLWDGQTAKRCLEVILNASS